MSSDVPTIPALAHDLDDRRCVTSTTAHAMCRVETDDETSERRRVCRRERIVRRKCPGEAEEELERTSEVVSDLPNTASAGWSTSSSSSWTLSSTSSFDNASGTGESDFLAGALRRAFTGAIGELADTAARGVFIDALGMVAREFSKELARAADALETTNTASEGSEDEQPLQTAERGHS